MFIDDEEMGLQSWMKSARTLLMTKPTFLPVVNTELHGTTSRSAP